MKRKNLALSFLFYVGLWLLWSVWKCLMVPRLWGGEWAVLLDAIPVKLFVWTVLPALVLWRGREDFRVLFRAHFPWLPCLVGLCVTAAFLWTLRLLNGLGGTHVVFDPMILAFSLSAGVAEELGFRGCFFSRQEESLGLWPAALLNGLFFTLYHYPGLLFGESWGVLLSLRALLLFVMGVVFCWMFWRWRNLALNMTIHTVWDLLSYLFCLAG